MVESRFVGHSSECPHCFEAIEIPHESVVNKEKFVEPPGLRRMLREVRDREWEHMRRKLRNFRARIEQLEKHLETAKTAAATAQETAGPAAAEAEELRKQLGEMGEKFVLANQAFTAGRKQHDMALEKLRRDLELSRDEVQVLQKKLDTPSQALRIAQEELAKQKHLAEEAVTLKAELEWAKGELTDVRQQLAISQAEVEAEKAKVFLMEAAAVGEAKEAPKTEANSEKGADTEGGKSSKKADTELKAQLADLQKQNAALRAARDRVHDDLEQMKKTLAARDHEDGALENALTGLETGIKEVVWTLSARRERKA